MSTEGWIEVGNLDDIPRRGARRVTRSGAALPIAVFRTAEDEIFALVDSCPHRAGPLSEGIVQGCAVACPLHGWVVNLANGAAEAPDEGSTHAVPVRLDGGRIWLQTPAVEACGEDAG